MTDERALTIQDETEEDKPAAVPDRVWPLMLAYQAITGDTRQVEEWRERIEDAEHAHDLVEQKNDENRAILADRRAWRLMKATGRFGAAYTLLPAGVWLGHLVNYNGFGLATALAFMLPAPLAWKVGRKLWENASLAGMRSLGKKPGALQKQRSWLSGMTRGFGAGFGMGFVMFFLVGLISWIPNPAPTLTLEVLMDLYLGVESGILMGIMGAALGPLVTRPAPDADEPPLLGSGE